MPTGNITLFHEINIVFVSRIAVLLLTVGTQSMLAWILGPADRGSLAVCQVFSFIMFLLFTVGINASGIYYISSKRISLSEGVVNILAVCSLCSFFAIVCGLVALETDLPVFAKADRTGFILSLMTIPALMIQISITNLLTAVGEFRWYAVLSALDQFWLFSLTALFVGLLKLSVEGALLAYLIEGTLTAVSALIFLRTRYRITFMLPRFPHMKMLFSFGIRYHFGKISNFLNLQLGTMFMAFLASKADVGCFAVASQTVSKITVIPDTLFTVLMPKISESIGGGSGLIARTARMTFILCGMILLAVIIFARPIVAVLFSPHFSHAVPIIQVLAIGSLFRSASKIYEPYLLGINRPGSVSFSSIVSVAVNFILIIALMPSLGVIGAAIGTSIAYFTGGIMLLVSFHKHSGDSFLRIVSLQRADIESLKNFFKKPTGRDLRIPQTRMPS